MKLKNKLVLGALGGIVATQFLSNENNVSRHLENKKKTDCQKKKEAILKENIKKALPQIKAALTTASAIKSCNPNVDAQLQPKINIQGTVELGIKGKVDLGKKKFMVDCGLFNNETTVTTVGECTITTKTSNCRESNGNCVCDVDITVEGDCGF